MNKVEKIRREIEKRYEYWKEKELNSHNIESESRMSECNHLLSMIISLSDTEKDFGIKSNDLEEASYNWVMNNYGSPKESLFTFDQRCFIAGAQWQKKQLIDKACDWLADNYSKYIITNGLPTIFSAIIDFDTIRMIEAFKKAMEE